MMPLFAEMSAEGWAVIIGAILIGLQQLYRMYLTAQEVRRQTIRDEKAHELAMANVELALMNSAKIDDVARTGETAHVLANSAMLAEKLGRAEADERLAARTGAEEDRVRAVMSRKAADLHKEEQVKLTEQIKAAAEKRAASDIEAAEKLQMLGPLTKRAGKPGEELVELKKIESNTGKMADKMTDAVIESTEATAKMTDAMDAAAERDKTHRPSE